MSDRSTEKNPRMRRVFFLHRVRELLHKYFVEPLVSSRNPPWFDARGAAVGLAVGFGVPVGGQVIFLGLLRLVFRFNSVIAFAFTWVTNPVSFVPMYYGYYYVGSLIVGAQSMMSEQAFRQLISPVLNQGYFWDSWYSFMLLGWQFLKRWLVTASIVAPLSALIGYVTCYRIQRIRHKRRAEKMGISYKALLRDFEERLARGPARDK
jgi:uncharacterized protein (DUF2062 family)